MKKVIWWIAGLSIALVLGGIFFFFSSTVTASIPSASSYVPASKDWSINFSKQMDPDTFTNESVKVINAKQGDVPISLEWNPDFTMLIIKSPIDGYTLNQTFQLKILDTVQTAKGKDLSKTFTHSFQIVGELPNIENKKQLRSLLNERMENRQQLFSATNEMAVTDTLAESSDSGGLDKSAATSETNVQVDGIDEGDMIKTDGEFIYFSREADIIITTSDKQNSKFISKITEENFRPEEIYLHNNQLISIGHTFGSIREDQLKSDNNMDGNDISIYPISHNQTTVFIYDVTDHANPKKVKEVTIEGSFTASRKMENHLYLVANEYPPYQILEDESAATDLRPFVKDTAVSKKGQPIAFDDMYFFPDSNEGNFLLIGSIDLSHLEKAATVESYLGASNEMYMSKNYIYIAVNKYETEKPTNDRSKDTMIARPANTEINQFKIDGGRIKYNASTVVNGTLINQFAMDERNETFRVATTKGDMWQGDEPSTNNVYTFDLQLNPLGSIEGLAKGEQIYSVRFMADIAYMVTFKQVDPLFVIDLADPKNPTVLGKLKVPGFSNYLHPLDENHVIGFGQNTKQIPTKNAKEPQVRMDGLKISVFDVSDHTDPKEIYSEIIGQGGSYTELNHNHKALFKHPDKNMFGFPAALFETKTIQQGDAVYQDQTFIYEGAFIYNITPENGIILKDTITHQENAVDHPAWEAQMKRLVSVDDYLYTFSYNRMKVYDINKEMVIQSVKLPNQPDM